MIVSAFICKVCLHTLHGAVSLFSLDPHQGPCTGADVYRIVIVCRHCKHCASCVVRCRQDDCTVKPYLFLHFLCKVSHYRPRHGYRQEHLRVISQHIDQFIIPVVGLRADQLSRRSLCILVFLHPCEQEVEIIRDHQDCFRLFQIFRMGLFYSHELIDRVEDLFLDACPCIQVILRNNFIHFLIHALCAAVAVSHRIAKNVIVLVEENIIHTPCIDTHGNRDLADLLTLFETVFDLRDQALYIPAQRSVLIVHSVRETIHFFKLHLSVFHAGEHMASAGCTDINGQIILFHL